MASKQKTRKSLNTQKKKKNTQNQNNTSKQNNTKKDNSIAQENTVKEKGAMQDEIILVVNLVIAILLFLSNLNLGGKLGNFFSGTIFGIVGLEAYVLPFAIFFLVAFYISNYGNKRAGRKILSFFVLMIALAALIEMMTTKYSSDTKIYEYFTNSFHNKNGGGIIGGILVMILCSLFDEVATYVILIAIIAIALIVITGKAIFTLIAAKGVRSYEERKDYRRLKREEQKEAISDNGSSDHRFQRRPPKTFILDSNATTPGSKLKDDATLVNVKDKRGKKNTQEKDSQGQEEKLPELNFDHLFSGNDSSDTIESKDDQDVNTATYPTYEDELRDKFGKKDLSIEEIHDTPTAIHSETTDVVKPNTIKTEAPLEKKQDKENNTTSVENLNISQVTSEKQYIFPPIQLLNGPKPKANKSSSQERDLKETAMKLQSTLESFGVHVTITNVSCGPSVTRYELQPEQGVKVSRITSLADDIKLNLAAADVRIEAPIPGKAAVGIEVPNKENSMVTFREMIESREFTDHSSDLAFAVGKDIGGQSIITDIGKMPHLLIAGATGSGKSVCINTLVMSILYKSNPSDVRLIMIDPKVVELSVYNGIPHLLIPVVTDPKKASAALNWAVMEMTERYNKFAEVGVRDLKGYNEKAEAVAHLNDENYQKLPKIVIIIDELADLMMVAPGEVEDAICRLAQMARAAGLYLIIATQRPSVNVITGLIKANIPSRIAFAVSSAIDSRTIIDGSGAEKLLGKGDMLFFPSGYPKPVRIQGAFISDKEVSSVVEFLKENNNEAQYSEDIHDKITNARASDGALASSGGDDRDDYFIEAAKFIIEKDKASIGMLQRVYKIGFNRAARIMDQLSEAGVVGPEEGTKPRKILMSMEQFEQYLEEN